MNRKDGTGFNDPVEVTGSLRIQVDGFDFGDTPATYISVNATREQLIEQIKDFPETERFDACFYRRGNDNNH